MTSILCLFFIYLFPWGGLGTLFRSCCCCCSGWASKLADKATKATVGADGTEDDGVEEEKVTYETTLRNIGETARYMPPCNALPTEIKTRIETDFRFIKELDEDEIKVPAAAAEAEEKAPSETDRASAYVAKEEEPKAEAAKEEAQAN